MPIYYAILQTDVYKYSKFTKVSAVLRPSVHDRFASTIFPIDHYASSSEADWESVASGLEFALEQGEESVAIENHNLHVIHGLIVPGIELRHSYAKYHKQRILRLAEHMEWLGARWIPRDMNHADKLFRTGKLR